MGIRSLQPDQTHLGVDPAQGLQCAILDYVISEESASLKLHGSVMEPTEMSRVDFKDIAFREHGRRRVGTRYAMAHFLFSTELELLSRQ